MRLNARAVAIGATIMMVVLFCGFASERDEVSEVDVIVTAAPVYDQLADLRGEERFPGGAQLLLVRKGVGEPLVPGFAATADADVSYDGRLVLFAGKKQAGDPWQIWEVALADRSVRRVVSTEDDAERPLYLPEGRLVWAQRSRYGFQLQSAADGRAQGEQQAGATGDSGIVRLSYTHGSAFPLGVLQDGRILFESGFPLGEGSQAELYLVYSDGSGVEAYRCDHERARWGGAQVESGDVIFTHGASLARFSSPFATEQAVAAPQGEYAGGVMELPSGEWLASVRAGKGSRFSLKAWKPRMSAVRTLFAKSGQDLVNPVRIGPRSEPHYHPSALHPWNYANLLALDSRISRDGDLKAVPAAVRLESQSANGEVVPMETAPVEGDGSFFVKVPADRPIRFALLDKDGTVLRRERGWFWARGGEQRICVGCHTGPERASDNRVPAVLLRSTEPADLTGGAKSGEQHSAARGGN